MRLRSDALVGGTLGFLITFKACRKFTGFVIQRSQRPSGQGGAKPNRRRHPPGGARCCFFGNEWENPTGSCSRNSHVPSRRGDGVVSGLAERVSAATLAKMIRQKETFLPALSTHIATHTRAYSQFEELFPV